MINSFKRKVAFITVLAMIVSNTAVFTSTVAEELNSLRVSATSDVSTIAVSKANGYEEGAYVEWTGSTSDEYSVYYKESGGSYVQIDSMLIRQYADHFRADAVGLSAGSYTLKVVGKSSGEVETSTLTVSSYDRSGFAFSKNSPTKGEGIGAYNSDGTLKSGTQVVYVTEDTKNTVTADINGTVQTGIANITQQAKKCKTPLCFRIIGQVSLDGLSSSDMKSAYAIGVKEASNVTFEGIGDDATLYGVGMAAFKCNSVEIRNLGLMLWGGGSDGDAISLKESINVWVHNNDIFYGSAGSDSDQGKGDGSMDLKDDSQYVTISYNHFWDSGKMSLCGMKSETGENWITYHHNWFDHSDSRHPRIRTMSVHVYNNYYDGNSKYGVGAAKSSEAFVEANYFRNCKYPMLSSMQGSDVIAEGIFSGEDGGIIKSYGNYMEGQSSYITYQEDSVEFDAYEVTSRDEKVPSTVTAKQGGKTYSNFDTNSDIMYSYSVDDVQDVPSIVMSKAGRLNGGDFSFTFDNSVDDTNDAVNSDLMNKLLSYKTGIVAIGSGNFSTDPTPIVTTVTTTTEPTTVTTTVSQDTSSADTTVTTETPDVPSVVLDAIYCSPDGTGDGSSIDKPTSVLSAISSVKAGGVIYLLDGTYKFSETILIDENNCGTADAYKTIMAYPNANVVWDFSAMAVSDSNRGVVLDGDYWHFYGFEITKAGDNGMLLSGSNNVIQMMVFNNNQDTGLQISRYNANNTTIDTWPSNNLILNCTSKNNCDDATMENADGFAAKLTCGEGNIFDGCMSYNNSDDGWDLFAKEATGPIGVVTIQNCIAFRNGYTEDGRGYGDCDGNGFKLGGSGVGSAHVVKNCLAFENINCGFTDNNNPKLESLTNCTAFNNNYGKNGKPNFSLYRCTDDGCDFKNILSYYNADGNTSNDKFEGTMENSILYNSKYYRVTDKIDIENGYKGATDQVITLSDSDFVSVVAPEMGSDFHKLWRNADGSINTNGFMQLVSDSNYSGLGSNLVDYDGEKYDVPTENTDPQPTVTTTPSSETTITTTLSDEPTGTSNTSDTTTSVSDTTTSSLDVVDSVLGDVTGDGQVKSNDLLTLKKYLLGLEDLTDAQLKNADVTKDGQVKSNDLLTLKKYLLGLIEEF